MNQPVKSARWSRRQPNVRVWTNVGEARLGFFASVDAIADAKAEILERSVLAATLLVCQCNDRG